MHSNTPHLHTWPSSLWLDTAPKKPHHAAVVGAIQTEVLIIGAGFTGLTAALKLSQAGVANVVVDGGDVGWGASGRSGGQVNPMLPFNSPQMLKTILGSTYFERLTETSLNSADELFDLIRKEQISCDARQHGWLRTNHTDKAKRNSVKALEDWNAFGAGMELAEGTRLNKMAGTASYQSGVITPRGGAVHPLMLVNGLAEVAKRNGTTIFGQSTVTSLTQQDGKWTAQTAGGSVTADWVIVATNGYSDDLIPKLTKTIIPVTPIQIATDPLPDDVIETILPDGHTISDSRRVIMYARREPNNRIVYGGLGKPDGRGGMSGYDWLQKDAERVFPQLKGATWTHQWGGNIAITDDHLPHLHEPRNGMLVGLGYNGRGVAMSHVMGRVMAQRVLGKAADDLPFPTSPIKAMPFRRTKLMGMGSAIWFMRFLDYLETR